MYKALDRKKNKKNQESLATKPKRIKIRGRAGSPNRETYFDQSFYEILQTLFSITLGLILSKELARWLLGR